MIFKNLILKSITIIITSLCSLTIVAIIPSSEYGIFQQFMSLAAILSAAVSMGIPNLIGRRVSKTENLSVKNVYYNFIIQHHLKISFITLTFIYALTYLKDIKNTFIYMIVFCLSVAFSKSLLSNIQNNGGVNAYVILGQLVRPLFLICFIAFIFYSNFNINAEQLLLFEALSGVSIFCMVFIFNYYFTGSKHTRIHSTKFLYLNTIPLGAMTFVIIFYNKIDVLIMSYFLGNQLAGQLFFSLKIIGIANILILSSLTVYGPTLIKFVKNGKMYEAKRIIEKSNIYIFGFGFIAAFFWLFSGELIIDTLNPDYIESYDYTLLLLFLFLITNTYFAASYIAVHTLSKATLIRVYLCMWAIGAILCMLSIYFFGVFGFLISHPLTRLIENIVINHLLKDKFGLNVFIFSK